MFPRARWFRQRRSRADGHSFRHSCRHAALLLVCGMALAAAACGKKGPPLAPLVRVPQAVSPVAVRVDNQVFVTFDVATRNVDGSSPADISRVDLVALTAETQPTAAELSRFGTRVGSVAVAPPPRLDRDGQPIVTTSPPDGVSQGAMVTLTERLGPDAATPVALPRKPPAPPTRVPDSPAPEPPPAPRGEPQPDARRDAAAGVPAAADVDGPLAGDPAAAPAAPRRYYMAIGVSPRGRESSSVVTSVPMRMPPPAPSQLTIDYSRDRLTLSWDAVEGGAGYFIYRVERGSDAPVSAGGDAAPGVPQPLNEEEQRSTSFTEPVVFGEERCYQVRTASLLDDELLQGAPSPVACETAVDTFAPAAPAGLRALAGDGGIDLVWEPGSEPDLAGYAILRARAGDATLLEIAQTPATQTRFSDRTVVPGVRYEYAVVAFDTATPPNRSGESERDDELAP